MSYIEHIVEQIQHNVSFLVENGHMSQEDADLVFSRLPAGASVPASAPATVSSAPALVSRRSVPAPPPPSRGAVQAKAIWAYNESGQASLTLILICSVRHLIYSALHSQDPDDLSFRPGDVIEIVSETNADWWTGKFNGKQGLFPSNHVEKVVAPAGPVRTILSPPPQYNQPPAAAATVTAPREKVAYRPFAAAHHGTDKPPPPAVNSLGLQEAEGQDKKKSKYGKLGNTVSVLSLCCRTDGLNAEQMANSAAGGVGFGAGKYCFLCLGP